MVKSKFSWAQFLGSPAFATSMTILVILLAASLLCTALYGSPLADLSAFLMIFSCWVLVGIAVGDQIVKNYHSGRASQQISWNVVISNLVHNCAWAAFSWGTGDPTYLAARALGFIFDQVLLLQMIASLKEEAENGSLPALKKYGSLLIALLVFLLVVFTIVGIPILMPEAIRTETSAQVLNVLTILTYGWVMFGWILQVIKNQRVGTLTGRDYSLRLPILIEVFVLASLLKEFVGGTHRVSPYLIASTALIVNTVLMVQCWIFHRQWIALSDEERATLDPGKLHESSL